MTETATCRACGTEPRAGARFCDVCGAPVKVAPNAEYKQVTVLFADVVRSMDIATTLGAERLREIMSELFNRSAAVVRRYGGTVDKFTGDGIMAIFEHPWRWRTTLFGPAWPHWRSISRPRSWRCR